MNNDPQEKLAGLLLGFVFEVLLLVGGVIALAAGIGVKVMLVVWTLLAAFNTVSIIFRIARRA